MSSYFDVLSWTRARKNREALEKTNPQNPVLNEEDEQFLDRIASLEAPAPPLPELEPTAIADDGTEEEASRTQKEAAEMILPSSPGGVEEEKKKKHDEKMEGKEDEGKEKRSWSSYIPSIPAIPSLKSKKGEADGEKDKKGEEKDQEKESKKSAEEEVKDTQENASAEAAKVQEPEKEEKNEQPKYHTQEPKEESKEASQEAFKEESKEEPAQATEEQPKDESPAEAKETVSSTAAPDQEPAEDSKTEPESKTGEETAESKPDEEPKPEEKKDKETEKTTEAAQRTWASYIPAMPTLGRGTKGKEAEQDSEKDASSIAAAAAAEAQSPETREKDEREVSVLIDRLNLSAINNRVFSFSDKSQQIYQEFTLILKDMVNGAPTAYEDMETLIKKNERHLEEMFGNMPPFVQTLVKSLPAKLGSSLGPEIMAAASEKPGADLKTRMEAASRPSSSSAAAGSSLDFSSKKKQKRKVPGVKALAQEKGAVASMLSNILNFLKVRFPAFVTGTNVLMSLAVFILLFVFWYCHKRGRETRLLKESESAKVSAAVSEASESEDDNEKAEKVEDPTPEMVAEIEKAAGEGQDEKVQESGNDEAEEDQDEPAGVEKLDVSGPDNNAAAQAKKILEQPAPAEVPLPEKE